MGKIGSAKAREVGVSHRRSKARQLTFVALLVAAAIVAVTWAVLPNREADIGSSREPGSQGSSAATWRSLPESPTSSRTDHAATWTGSELIVWGGFTRAEGSRDIPKNDGAGFSPRDSKWRSIAAAPIAPRSSSSAVWTGSELIVWGGFNNSPQQTFSDGAAFDPGRGRWRPLATSPLQGRLYHVAVWAGDRMLVWGGSDWEGASFRDGAAYDPVRNSWALLPPSPLQNDGGRLHRAVWTGQEMIVTGTRQGAAYNPATNSWRDLPSWPLSAVGVEYEAVWSGKEVIVWSSCCPEGTDQAAVGAAYDPAKDAWRSIPAHDVGATRGLVLWSGDEMLVFGEKSSPTDGMKPWQTQLVASAYDPAADAWRDFTPTSREARTGARAVWTGSAALLWGGVERDGERPRDVIVFEER